MTIGFYLYTFVLITWLIYILNSFYQNHKMEHFLPNKKIEILTVPFYIFYLVSFYLLIQKLINILLINDKKNAINFNASWLTPLIVVGVIFCFCSIVLFIYANFFEKSFPSCIVTKNNEPLQGLYKYIRHPSYYIFFFITFGTSLCLLNILLFILACVNHICLYFYYMIEENQIRKTNLYYDKYLKRTNRFLPNFFKTPIDQN